MADRLFWQDSIILGPMQRGFHSITEAIITAFADAPPFQIGLLHLFLQHTSASLAISENTCPEVAKDLEEHLNRLVPDNETLYSHILEGKDDMPAHIKNVLLGSSLTIPITTGKLNLGRWQGIFLAEHRLQAPARRIVLTAQGIE